MNNYCACGSVGSISDLDCLQEGLTKAVSAKNAVSMSSSRRDQTSASCASVGLNSEQAKMEKDRTPNLQALARFRQLVYRILHCTRPDNEMYTLSTE